MAKEKNITKSGNSKVNKNAAKSNKTEVKKDLWTEFRIFCNGVKSEFKKVHWTTKKDLVRYSVATIAFVVCMAVFFYLIDVIFALIQTLV